MHEAAAINQVGIEGIRMLRWEGEGVFEGAQAADFKSHLEWDVLFVVSLRHSALVLSTSNEPSRINGNNTFACIENKADKPPTGSAGKSDWQME